MCARELASDMRYCPYCGIRVGEGGAPPGTLQMAPPSPYGQSPYPMPYPGAYPYPMMYPPYYRPITQKRVFGITGGVLLIVAGAIMLIPGFVLLFDWWDPDLITTTAGLVDVIAFALAIAGAVAAFKRSWRVLAPVGAAFLIGACIVTAIEMPEFMIIVAPIGVISLVFMGLGYGEMTHEAWPGYGQAGPGALPSPFGTPAQAPREPHLVRYAPGEGPGEGRP